MMTDPMLRGLGEIELCELAARLEHMLNSLGDAETEVTKRTLADYQQRLDDVLDELDRRRTI